MLDEGDVMKKKLQQLEAQAQDLANGFNAIVDVLNDMEKATRNIHYEILTLQEKEAKKKKKKPKRGYNPWDEYLRGLK